MQIYMQCDRGEIEVFLCPEEETLGIPPEANAGGFSSDNEDGCSIGTADGGHLGGGGGGVTDSESEASPIKVKLYQYHFVLTILIRFLSIFSGSSFFWSAASATAEARLRGGGEPELRVGQPNQKRSHLGV